MVLYFYRQRKLCQLENQLGSTSSARSNPPFSLLDRAARWPDFPGMWRSLIDGSHQRGSQTTLNVSQMENRSNLPPVYQGVNYDSQGYRSFPDTSLQHIEMTNPLRTSRNVLTFIVKCKFWYSLQTHAQSPHSACTRLHMMASFDGHNVSSAYFCRVYI